MACDWGSPQSFRPIIQSLGYSFMLVGPFLVTHVVAKTLEKMHNSNSQKDNHDCTHMYSSECTDISSNSYQ